MWRLMIVLAACGGAETSVPDAGELELCGGDSQELMAPGATGVLTGADLDHDGHVDVIATVQHGLLVALSHGDGTFSDTIALPLAEQVWNIAIGDVDGDGKPDLVAAMVGSIAVAHGNGDGSFAAPTSISAADPRSVALADFDGDGKLDLAIGGEVASEVRLGNGDGTFRSGFRIDVARAFSVTAVDADRDGHPDLVVGDAGQLCFFNCPPEDLRPGKLVLQRGRGDGTFEAATTLIAASYPSQLTITDFDRDGVPDLYVGSFGPSYALRGDGQGGFAVATVSEGIAAVATAVLDFDGDGTLDAVELSSNYLVVHLGHGDGTFAPQQSFSVDATAVVAIEGRLLAANQAGLVHALAPGCRSN